MSKKKEWGRNIIVETEEKRLEDVTLLALKMKGGAMSQEMQMHSRSSKREGHGFSPRCS